MNIVHVIIIAIFIDIDERLRNKCNSQNLNWEGIFHITALISMSS